MRTGSERLGARPALADMDVAALHPMHGLLLYLADCPEKSAPISQTEADFAQICPDQGSRERVRSLARMAFYAGLLTVGGGRYALTSEGRLYVSGCNRDDLSALPRGKAGRKLLVQLWLKRPDANPWYKSLQNMLIVLVVMGALEQGVVPSEENLDAPPHVITALLRHLEDLELIQGRRQGYRITREGQEVIGALRLLMDPRSGRVSRITPDDEIFLPQGAAEPVAGPVREAAAAALTPEPELIAEALPASAWEAAYALMGEHVEREIDSLRQSLRHLERLYYDGMRREEPAPVVAAAASAERSEPVEPPEHPLALVVPTATFRPVTAEKALLEDAARRLNDSGYRVDAKELANLWTCAKSGFLTVLAGPPGSGKSSLVRRFTEALGHRSTLCQVAVRRGWTDDQTFIGAVNRLYQRFEPASTGIVPHLLAADADRDKGLYWCLLDEFNLSTPEYYFAEFISVLESEEPCVNLYGPGMPPRNAHIYPQAVPVGPNVHFFATINLDDTASPLSPRLIDRANVLWVERQVGPEILKQAPLKPPGVGPISASEVAAKFTQKPALPGPARHWWDELVKRLDDRKPEFGTPHVVSPRSMMGVARYIANTPQGLLEPHEAFDFALAQRVLPGLRGFGPGFGLRLERLGEFARGEKFTRSQKLLERVTSNGRDRGHEYDFLTGLW